MNPALSQIVLYVILCSVPRVSCMCSSLTKLTAYTTEHVIQESRSSHADCQWCIDSPDHVELNITEWSLLLDSRCSVDSLDVYDGSSTSAILLAKLCGHGSSRIMISSGQAIYLRLRTGDGANGRNFKFSYRSYGNSLPRCNRQAHEWTTRRYIKATSEEQTITSQSYPNNYPENTEEEWVIMKPTVSSSLALIIVDMDIEESHYCGYDYLAIYKGHCSTDKLKAKVCGKSKYSWTLEGSSSNVLIRFKSDSGTTGKGFRLKFFIGKAEETEDDKNALHAILIGLITICIVLIVLLIIAKLYLHCLNKPKVRPNQEELNNRRTVLEVQARRGSLGRRLVRMITARTIHAEMTRYLRNNEHDSRVSTIDFSSSGASAPDLVYEDGMYQPPSYSALFRHTRPPYVPTNAPDDDSAPPPYPGSPALKPEIEKDNVVEVQTQEGTETVDQRANPPPPYEQQ